VTVAALAVPRGLADLAAFAPVQRLALLDARRELPTGEDWNRARRNLQRVRSLDPHNPAHAETLARWYERYALRLPAASGVARAYLEQSAAHLRDALTRRPGSPYAWASLAAVKLRLGALDAEFQAAMENAWRLGPWEPGVQLALAEIAFRAGAGLAPGACQAARSAIANAAQRHSRELSELARRYGQIRGADNFFCDTADSRRDVRR
jgi:cytochrome c-type biogenesis protein CcmH/NrfG